MVDFLCQRSATFSCKSQRVKIVGSVAHMVSVTALQLCRCSVEAAVDICTPVSIAKFQYNFIYECGKLNSFNFYMSQNTVTLLNVPNDLKM